MFHVTEIEPQSRFKHLVDLQEYDRAEDLAVEFHLDRQYLYLGRVRVTSHPLFISLFTGLSFIIVASFYM